MRPRKYSGEGTRISGIPPANSKSVTGRSKWVSRRSSFCPDIVLGHICAPTKRILHPECCSSPAGDRQERPFPRVVPGGKFLPSRNHASEGSRISGIPPANEKRATGSSKWVSRKNSFCPDIVRGHICAPTKEILQSQCCNSPVGDRQERNLAELSQEWSVQQGL